MKEFFDILRHLMDKESKMQVVQKSEELGSLMLETFNLRHIQLSPRTEESYTDEEIQDVEEAMNSTAIAIIYKLNDTAFRPIFTRLMDCATAIKKDGGRYLLRLTTFYSFLFKFFSTLKVSSHLSF